MVSRNPRLDVFCDIARHSLGRLFGWQIGTSLTGPMSGKAIQVDVVVVHVRTVTAMQSGSFNLAPSLVQLPFSM